MTAASNVAAAAAELALFQAVLEREASALVEVSSRLMQETDALSLACELLGSCRRSRSERRRVIVSGVGKAGLVGRKVAATLSSTGTSSFFVHPVEALHGDLGGVCRGDCGLLLSYSGETPEIVKFARELRRLSCHLIALTRTAHSELGRLADAVIPLGDIPEACGLGLAPSSTTTAMLAVGDALAIAVAKKNGFSAKDFAGNHPAGMLGLQFRQVSEYMRTERRLVCVPETATVQEVVRQVSQAKTGAAVLVRENGTLVGIFTDGDLRRALLHGGEVLARPVSQYATCPCNFVESEQSVADAWKTMLHKRIEDLPVISESGAVVGLLCLKDIKW